MHRIGALVVIWSSLALAQQPTPRSLFDEGAALYAKGQFAAAAAKFEASFAARPVPVTKFNIARSWEQAGDALKAIDAWQAWLVMSPTAAERPEAERSLKALGDRLAKLGVQALTITSLPLGARVSVDGVAAGVVPLTVELTPTRHLLRLEAEGRAPIERSVVVTLEHPMVEFFELQSLEQSGALPARAVLMPAPLPAPTVPRPTDPDFSFALSDDTVQVHIDTKDKEVRLYRFGGNPNGECRAPCDAPVSRASEQFMIAGAGIVPSNPFVLLDHARGKQVFVKVKTGSAGWFYGGGVVLITGGIAGLAIALASVIVQPRDAGLPIGLGLSLGTAATIGGVLCFALNGTSVSFK